MRPLIFILTCVATSVFAQLPFDEQQFFSRLKTGAPLPEQLLTTRTAVFYPFSMPLRELGTVQTWFQKTGIDPVVYFESGLLTAGRDVVVSLAQYLNSREISNLILIQKNESGYVMWITEYNKKANFVEKDQGAFREENRFLEELLRKVYRTASSGLKKENFLINDFPETEFTLNAIEGRRSEIFAMDLKVDPLAVPKFGNEAMDKELEEIMKSYPFKYTLTDPQLSESELRKQGYLFVLRFVHTRDRVAKLVLGYDMAKSETAIVSITYPDSQPQVKNISANIEVYKFYFKHIESGNVYLGTKWDADLTWQQALINQIKGLKIDLKIN